jgi:hypothetical protein
VWYRGSVRRLYLATLLLFGCGGGSSGTSSSDARPPVTDAPSPVPDAPSPVPDAPPAAPDAPPAAPDSPPAAPDAPPMANFPSSEFVFGFNLIAGIGIFDPSAKPASPWPLSDAQLAILRDEIGINSIRFFVHPTFLGLPQKTWNGPEAIQYSAFKDSDYVWDRPETPVLDSLDEYVRYLYAQGITPMLQPMLPDDYINWIYQSDITSLNGSRGVDYTGIVPAHEVQAIVVAIAAHMQKTFGRPFLMNLPEICGQNPAGPALRTSEQAVWQQIENAVKAVAPLAEFQGAEICTNVTWAWTELKDGCGNFQPFPVGSDGPPSDALSNYAQVYGEASISGGLMSGTFVQNICPGVGRLRASSDQFLYVVRDWVKPKKWLLAETSWAAQADLDEEHINWANIWFGLDNVRGVFVWDIKANPAEETNPPAGATVPSLWSSTDVPSPAIADWKVMGPILGANRAFFGTYHTVVNGDGLTTDSDQFSESDPAVITRKLDKHLVLFSAGPSQIVFGSTNGAMLAPAYGGGAVPTIQNGANQVTVSGITPNRLYLFAIK